MYKVLISETLEIVQLFVNYLYSIRIEYNCVQTNNYRQIKIEIFWKMQWKIENIVITIILEIKDFSIKQP